MKFKEDILKELDKYNVKYEKIRFFKVSPYQKRRYLNKFVGSEIWIYKNNGLKFGYLICETDWNKMTNEMKKETILSI